MILHPLMSTVINLCCLEYLLASPTTGHHLIVHTRENIIMATICDTKWSFSIRTAIHICPKTTKLISYTKKGNLPEPIRTSHDLAHYIGFQKPLGYKLEWPHVIPDTSCTHNWAPNEASYHDLHPKLCRNPPRVPTLHQKLPGTQLASLGETCFQTA